MPAKDGTVDEEEPTALANTRSDEDVDANLPVRQRNAEPDDDPHTPGIQSRVRDTRNISYSVGAVAKHLGVSPATLRTWDRRYGLGPSDHPSGTHRRYGAEDIERLAIMRRLTTEGVSTAQAAQVALTTEMTPGAVSLGTPMAAPRAADPSQVSASALAQAARAGDHQELVCLLSAADTIENWWTELVGPALAELQEGAGLVAPGTAPGQLLRCAAMIDLARRRPAAPPGPATVLVAAPESADILAAHALGAALQARGIASAIADCRPRHLPGLVAGARPRVLAVVGDHATPTGLDFVAQVAQLDAPPLVVVTGAPAALALPTAAERVRTFVGAVHEIAAAVGEPS